MRIEGWVHAGAACDAELIIKTVESAGMSVRTKTFESFKDKLKNKVYNYHHCARKCYNYWTMEKI